MHITNLLYLFFLISSASSFYEVLAAAKERKNQNNLSHIIHYNNSKLVKYRKISN